MLAIAERFYKRIVLMLQRKDLGWIYDERLRQ